MDKRNRDFVKIVAAALPVMGPIYEFGAFQVPGQEAFADLRPLFPDMEYVGCDMREGRGVDKLINLHSIDLPSESVGTAICLNTLEHVEFPRKAVEEMHRVLMGNGIAIVSSVMNFPIHDYPYDFWRFTPQGFRSILSSFAHCFVGYAGIPQFPQTIVGIGFKGEAPPLAAFTRMYERWQRKQTLSVEFLVKAIVPQILHPALSKFRKAVIRVTAASR